jgi:hypothetical protein
MNLPKCPGWILVLLAAATDFQVIERHAFLGENFDDIHSRAGCYRDQQQVGGLDPYPFVRRGENHRVLGRIDPNELFSGNPFYSCGSHNAPLHFVIYDFQRTAHGRYIYPLQENPLLVPQLLPEVLEEVDDAVLREATTDSFFRVLGLLQCGQTGSWLASENRSVFSNSVPHSLQRYS